MDEIEVSWELPKPYDEMTEDDWDALTDEFLSNVTKAAKTLLASDAET